jgi:hypothetical protein
MVAEAQRNRLRTFVIGGVVGASAAFAAVRRRRPGRPQRPPRAGLAAFDDAPCYAELLEEERLRRSQRPE